MTDPEFDRALTETRSEYREALDRLSDDTTEALDACEHGFSYDADCRDCDALTALFMSFGAMTPNEIGIASRAYRAGAAASPPRTDGLAERVEALAAEWQRMAELREGTGQATILNEHARRLRALLADAPARTYAGSPGEAADRRILADDDMISPALVPSPVPASEDGEALAAWDEIAAKWDDASRAVRKAEHHWPADCLAEAAEIARSFAARINRERAAALREAARAYDETEARPGDHAAAWLRGRADREENR